MNDPDVISIVVAISVVFGLFLIGRVIVLWYWKVDQIVNLLEKIENPLVMIGNMLVDSKEK